MGKYIYLNIEVEKYRVIQKRLQSTSVNDFWPAFLVDDWQGQSIPSDDYEEKKTQGVGEAENRIHICIYGST